MGSGWCSWWSLHCDSSHPKVKTKADLEFRRACSLATRKEPNSHGNTYIAASKGRWEASLALNSSSKYCCWLKRSFLKLVCCSSPGMMVSQQSWQHWLTDTRVLQWDCYSRLPLSVYLATITPDFKQTQLILAGVDEGPRSWTFLQQYCRTPHHLGCGGKDLFLQPKALKITMSKKYTCKFSAIFAFPAEVLVTTDLPVDL